MQKTLSPGQKWELEFFGVTVEHGLAFTPEYLDYEASVENILEQSKDPLLARMYRSYDYDPAKPKPGKSRDLWREVRRNLPSPKPGTKYGLPHERLYLYLALGQTALDFYHGVDAFFCWRGVHVSVDASMMPKSKEGEGKLYLKADYVITPYMCDPSGIASLGKEIAGRLLKRATSYEPERVFRCRLPISRMMIRAGA